MRSKPLCSKALGRGTLALPGGNCCFRELTLKTGIRGQKSNARSMPNETPKSPLLTAVELLIGLLGTAERARLRPWLLAKFDVQGYPQRTFEPRDPHQST
jgi:hypothetical protein